MSQVPSTHPQNLSMLAKRRIEAEILGHVYEVLKASHGKEAAMQAVGNAVRRSSIDQAQRFAAETEGPTSLQSFIDISSLWESEDALKIEVREKTDTAYVFDVVRCRDVQGDGPGRDWPPAVLPTRRYLL